nr:reverse transcriptase domain-containing protein [Tanacetum cinerariifolium]
MEGKKLKDLKNKSFDSIQKMFDRAFKKVNTFVDSRTEVVEGSSKRAGEELTQESAKKQKVEDDKETAELKQLIEIIPDKEEVAIDAISLAVNLRGLLAGIHGLFSGRRLLDFVDVFGYFHDTACLYLVFLHVVVSLYRRKCVVVIPFLVASRVFALAGYDRLQLQNIIPQIVTQVTANVNNANGGNGNGRNNGCSYKTFTACNPKEFDRKGGAVALTCWIEKMESVFDNSGCTANQRVSIAHGGVLSKQQDGETGE